MKTAKIILLLSLLYPFFSVGQDMQPTVILYDKVLTSAAPSPELVGAQDFSEHGLRMINGQLARLNFYYSLAARTIRYHARFSADSKAVFQSDQGDFKAYIDMVEKSISMETNPIKEMKVPFLDAEHEYIIEIEHNYQSAKLRIIDLYTGDEAEIFATNDGTGGSGRGAIGKGFHVGLQHDYYCFGLASGNEILIKQITVLSHHSDLTLLMYGDSITEPEGYFPTADFPKAWTQLIINDVKGKAMASGRGGTTVNEILVRIKNELPYVKAKYVMVTIGTNTGNTEENLSELIEYIQKQGSIPILNNIPANERGTHVPFNMLIEKVRQKYGIKGCKFDLATTINFDGKEVDKSTMYYEDLDWGQIYHHPNVKGSRLMYLRTLLDVPEIYE